MIRNVKSRRRPPHTFPVLSQPDPDERLRKRMRELRTGAGMSQAEFGQILGLRQSAYSELENGPTAVRRGDLAAVAMYFGMSLADAFPMYEDPIGEAMTRARAA